MSVSQIQNKFKAASCNVCIKDINISNRGGRVDLKVTFSHSLRLSVWVNNQVEPASVQPTTKLLEECGNNRFHKSGDIILTLNMVKKLLFFHKLYRHCTDFSEYVLNRYDSKQMALGEPNRALWQSLESVHI